jgi:hypothetical protein
MSRLPSFSEVRAGISIEKRRKAFHMGSAF